METQTFSEAFSLADTAVAQLLRLSSERASSHGGLRIAIKGGGCSGLMYEMDWADKPKEKDKVFEKSGARVFIDSRSLLYLRGSELVYETGLLASGFKMRNPNKKSECGCGESFSV